MRDILKKAIIIVAPILFPLVKLYNFVFKKKQSGVKVIIENENYVLLVKHTYIPGLRWDLPGGAVKRFEDPKDAAKREVKEELNISLGDLKELDVIASEKRGRITVFVAFSQKRDVVDGNLEIAEARWFGKDNMPEMSEISKRSLEKYGKY